MKLFVFSLMCLAMSAPAMAYDYSYGEAEAYGSHGKNEIVITEDNEAGTEAVNYNYNFGNVRVNRGESTSFTVRNNGRLPFLVDRIRISGDSDFRQNNNCPRVLFRGARCSIRVSFRPQSTGNKSARLEIDLTGSQDINVRLRGRGVNRY